MTSRISIGGLLGLVMGVCVALVLAISAVVAQVQSSSSLETTGLEAVHGAAVTFESLERSQIGRLSAVLEPLLADPKLQTLYLARDREGLLAATKPLFDQLRERHRITHFYFLDPAPARTCFLRVHKPAQFDDVVHRATLLKAVETGEQAAGLELGKTAFALRVVRPWKRDGAVIGYLELGQEIDDFLDTMKTLTGDEFGMVLDKAPLDPKGWATMRGAQRNNWDDYAGFVVADATADERAFEFGAELLKLQAGGEVLDSGLHSKLLRGAFPLRDAAGQTIGGVVVRRDVRAELARAANLATTLAGSMAAILVGVLGLAWLVLRRQVVSPVMRLSDAAAAVAGGDLSQRLEAAGTLETSALARSFQHMTESLRTTLADVRGAAGAIEGSAATIRQGAARQAASTAEQSTAIAETHAVAAEIAAKARAAGEKADAVAAAAERSETLSGQGLKAVEDARAGIEQLGSQVSAIAKATETLSSNAERIGEIIEAVKDLAEQSNLLAINAAIEAAKAGESGKGFAVVAGEMRQLAEASRGAAVQVGAILGEVQKGTHLTAQATEQGSERARAAVTLAEGAGTAIGGLARANRDSSGAAREITEGARRQTTDVEQIGQALRDISTAMADAVDGTRSIEKGAEELAVLAGRLSALVARYRV